MSILEDLVAECDEDIQGNLRKYLNYLWDYYFSDNARYPFNTWDYYTDIINAESYQDLSRCNNVSESLNARLNRSIRASTSNMHKIIDLLQTHKIEENAILETVSPKSVFNIPDVNQAKVRPVEKKRTRSA